MASQTTSDIDNLKKTCTESFKDIYSTYIHIKFLKVIIDSQMRFGSADDYLVFLIQGTKGKEKRIHSGIIDVFAEKSKKGILRFTKNSMELRKTLMILRTFSHMLIHLWISLNCFKVK